MNSLLISVLLMCAAAWATAALPFTAVFDASQDSVSQPVQRPPANHANDARPGQQSNSTEHPSDPAAALDFLGSYSAPQAVLATETGHTSSRPPSVDTERRLANLASDLGNQFTDSAETRRTIIEILASGSHSADQWFRTGTLALGAARADSRRLAEMAPSSDWNLRFQADALAARYPLIARSLWPAAPHESRSAPSGAAAEKAPAQLTDEPATLSGSPDLPRLGDELSKLASGAETPENLYRRARLLVEISGAVFKLAAASPVFDARLFALQALAAEEENDEGAALNQYRAGLARHPQDGLLHAGLGHLYRERNQLEPARAELEEARRLLPSDPLVAFDIGDVELRMGDPAGAVEMLNRALQLDSSLLVARWSRGRAYFELGGGENDRRALADLESAVSCDSSGVLQFQLSQLYARLGRNEKARQSEQKSLEQRRAAEQQKRGVEVKSP